MWSYSENIWPKAQRNWPNACAFDELRTHLVTVGRKTKCAAHLGKRAVQLAKCVRDLPNVAQLVKCRAFDQLVKCAARLPKCADWSNAPYIAMKLLRELLLYTIDCLVYIYHSASNELLMMSCAGVS